MQRIIGLLDMDFFYAQIEERDNPKLLGKPVIVGMYSGRGPDSGAVATCNYSARELGIKSGMPIQFAKRLAEKNKESVFVPARIPYYREVSQKIMDSVREFCPQIETVGLDEAYFDLTRESKGDFEKAKSIALKIKKKVLLDQSLTCSIGIAPNKLLAKIACDSKKPDGLTIVLPQDVQSFLNPLPPKKLLGVGPKTSEQLRQLEIVTIERLSKKPLSELKRFFGNAKGQLLFDSSHGIDESPIESEWQKLQISHIKTLPKDSNDPKEIILFLEKLSDELFERVQKENARFKEVAFIAVSNHLESFTKNKTMADYAFDAQTISHTAAELCQKFFELHPGIMLRRVGVRVGKLNRENSDSKPKKTVSLQDFV